MVDLIHFQLLKWYNIPHNIIKSSFYCERAFFIIIISTKKKEKPKKRKKKAIPEAGELWGQGFCDIFYTNEIIST